MQNVYIFSINKISLTLYQSLFEFPTNTNHTSFSISDFRSPSKELRKPSTQPWRTAPTGAPSRFCSLTTGPIPALPTRTPWSAPRAKQRTSMWAPLIRFMAIPYGLNSRGDAVRVETLCTSHTVLS